METSGETRGSDRRPVGEVRLPADHLEGGSGRESQLCPKCDQHFRSTPDPAGTTVRRRQYRKSDGDLVSTDPLKFTDLKPYTDRLKQAQKETGLKDALINARGT